MSTKLKHQKTTDKVVPTMVTNFFKSKPKNTMTLRALALTISTRGRIFHLATGWYSTTECKNQALHQACFKLALLKAGKPTKASKVEHSYALIVLKRKSLKILLRKNHAPLTIIYFQISRGILFSTDSTIFLSHGLLLQLSSIAQRDIQC